MTTSIRSPRCPEPRRSGRIDLEARADAGDLPLADAGLDAPSPATRLTLGERSGAELTGMTADSSLIDDELSLNCGGQVTVVLISSEHDDRARRPLLDLEVR